VEITTLSAMHRSIEFASIVEIEPLPDNEIDTVRERLSNASPQLEQVLQPVESIPQRRSG
jgi:hypothetical protein